MREFGIRRDPRKSEESFRNPRKLEGFSRNLFGSGFTGSQGFGGIQSVLRDPGGLVGFSGIGGIPGSLGFKGSEDPCRVSEGSSG